MNNKLQFYKKVLSYLKPFRLAITVSFVLKMIPSILYTVNDFLYGKIIDGLYQNNVTTITVFAGIFVASLLARTTIDRGRTIWNNAKIQNTLNHHITKVSLEKSFQLSLGQLRQEHSGFKQDVLKTGSDGIEQLHRTLLEEGTPLIATFLTSVAGLFLIDSTFGYTALIFAIIYYWRGTVVNNWIQPLIKGLIKTRIETNKTFLDILKNLFLLKFSGQAQGVSRHLQTVQTKQANYGMSMWHTYNIKHIVSDMAAMVYIVGSLVYTLHLILAGVLSAGMFIPVMAWIFSVHISIQSFRVIQRNTVIIESNIEKMFDMLEQKSDIVIDSNARPIKTFDKQISFEQVSFDYTEGKKHALVNINFEIKKGEKIALVGRSGSGKTTIMSLLLRLYDPTQGAIMIDGVDLRSLDLSDWHNMIGYVSQDGDIMDISIRENILFGARGPVAESEIEYVLEKAGIKEFIHHLPHGIDTKVGENGVKLSGGQRQRVCIARALIKDAPILMLDEATSSLDSETESIVNKAVWEMLGDKTGIVIAHRLSTILDADKIIVMDHGKIVGVGTHEALVKTTPYYKTLVDAQNISL